MPSPPLVKTRVARMDLRGLVGIGTAAAADVAPEEAPPEDGGGGIGYGNAARHEKEESLDETANNTA